MKYVLDLSNDITLIEQKISELGARYKQRRQKLEQQNSTLVNKDMLNARSKMPSCTTGKLQFLVNTVVAQITNQTLIHKNKYVPHAKLRTIVFYTFVHC